MGQVNQQLHSVSKSIPILANLPEYPFNRSQRYWHESTMSRNLRLRKHPRLQLLGTPLVDWNFSDEGRWQKVFDSIEMPWIEDHKVYQPGSKSGLYYPVLI